MEKFTVLSLFDGISCGQVALNRAGIKYDQYFASEIDANAIKVTQHNYPATIQLGDVTKIKGEDLPKISLLCGGFPCQSMSRNGNQEGFAGKSGLFYELLRLFNECKPQFFLVENVVMKKCFEEQITKMIGIDPVLIDSADFCAQRRKRLYWSNIPILPWQDKGILIKDIIEKNPTNEYEFVHEGFSQASKKCKSYIQYDVSGKGNKSQAFRAYFLDGKMGTFCHSAPHFAKILMEDGRIRKTTRIEHERLQTLPENYTSAIDLNKAKSAIGNGWTVDVIAHIFRGLKNI